MSIKLQFSKSNTVGSALICWRDWSDYSHMDVITPDNRLFGARGDGVKFRDHYPVIRKRTYFIEATEEQEILFYAALYSQEGKGYDFAGIIGFVANRDWQETDKWFCSELIMWALQEAGIYILRTENISRITPQHMLLSTCLKDAN